MRNYAIAALLAIMPTAADAAVTISFNGLADTDSYVRTVDDTADNYVIDAGTPTTSGQLVIDTAALGANGSGSTGVYYGGDGSTFLSGSFSSTGTTPILLTSGTASHYIAGDGDVATIEFSFEDLTSPTYRSEYRLTGTGVTLGTFDGVLLPDFSTAASVQFELISRTGDETAFTERKSAGSVLTVVQTAATAVPEPATWAMIIAGFALVGGVMRRRTRTSVAFA